MEKELGQEKHLVPFQALYLKIVIINIWRAKVCKETKVNRPICDLATLETPIL
jgi:hypothetical protein